MQAQHHEQEKERGSEAKKDEKRSNILLNGPQHHSAPRRDTASCKQACLFRILFGLLRKVFKGKLYLRIVQQKETENLLAQFSLISHFLLVIQSPYFPRCYQSAAWWPIRKRSHTSFLFHQGSKVDGAWFVGHEGCEGLGLQFGPHWAQKTWQGHWQR